MESENAHIRRAQNVFVDVKEYKYKKKITEKTEKKKFLVRTHARVRSSLYILRTTSAVLRDCNFFVRGFYFLFL